MTLGKKADISNIQLLFGIIVIFIGTAGATLWGVGIAMANPTLSWLGGSLFALVGFAVAILSRWLR